MVTSVSFFFNFSQVRFIVFIHVAKWSSPEKQKHYEVLWKENIMKWFHILKPTYESHQSLFPSWGGNSILWFPWGLPLPHCTSHLFPLAFCAAGTFCVITCRPFWRWVGNRHHKYMDDGAKGCRHWPWVFILVDRCPQHLGIQEYWKCVKKKALKEWKKSGNKQEKIFNREKGECGNSVALSNHNRAFLRMLDVYPPKSSLILFVI